MKFFVRGDSEPTRDWRLIKEGFERKLEALNAYHCHLKGIYSQLPEATKAFVLASWYHSSRSHDCPRDAWLMGLVIKAETESGGSRSVNVVLTLLGNCHDRILTFTYSNVVECNCAINMHGDHNVGDWLYDECDLVDGAAVSHEIVWQYGQPWRIVAKTISMATRERDVNEIEPQ